MKLDKIAFAKLIGHCVANGMTAGDYEIEKIEELVEFHVPEPVQGRADVAQLNNLMAFMSAGSQKIEAIKAYRALTGSMLKESKDAVEKYWPNQNCPEYFKKVQDALGTAETGNALVEVARNAHRAELEFALQHSELATLGDILRSAKTS